MLPYVKLINDTFQIIQSHQVSPAAVLKPHSLGRKGGGHIVNMTSFVCPNGCQTSTWTKKLNGLKMCILSLQPSLLKYMCSTVFHYFTLKNIFLLASTRTCIKCCLYQMPEISQIINSKTIRTCQSFHLRLSEYVTKTNSCFSLSPFHRVNPSKAVTSHWSSSYCVE